MRQILSRSLLTVAAASSVLAVTGGYANADSGAEGNATGSPGFLSGNNIQAPIDAPVNACGNSVDAGGALNPAFGNQCANESHHSAGARAGAGASSRSEATDSPGVLAGNSVAVPVHAPVNACGNTVDPVALLNPAFGNACQNGPASSVGVPRPPAHPHSPPQDDGKPPRPAQHDAFPQSATQKVLAETGITGGEFGAAGAAAAALVLGGAILYRRAPRVGVPVR